MASYNDFSKLDLRVAKIKSVEDIKNKDRLYLIKLDLGNMGERQVLAGIKKYYNKEELIGKKVIVIANLEPKKIAGIESQGMLLAAEDESTSKVSLITIDRDLPLGSKVY